MARNWGHSSWNQWWETEAKKFDALQAKCDWLQSMLEEKCNEMRRLDGEVTRLGQRVSGGPSAEPAPETEVKGSGERPLAEAAALEIDPERLTESHHHTTLRLNVDPIATAVSHAHTMSHSLAFPSPIEAAVGHLE